MPTWYIQYNVWFPQHSMIILLPVAHFGSLLLLWSCMGLPEIFVTFVESVVDVDVPVTIELTSTAVL